MKFNKAQFRAYLSLSIALSVVVVFSLRSLADESAASRLWDHTFTSQGPTGVLSSRGSVTINGNAAASGATVVTGNSIATGSDGYASIELGALGRIELKSHTAVTAILSPGSVPLNLDLCGSVTQTLPPGVAGVLTDPHHDRAHVKVIVGQVHVKYDGKEQDLKTGDSKTFDRLEEVSTPGGATFKVSCGEHREALYLAPLGLLGLAGLAVGLRHNVPSGGAISPSVP